MAQQEAPVVIGDVHGCAGLLQQMLARFPERQIVLLGDLVDRGPESATVVQIARQLWREERLTLIIGNHEELMHHELSSEHGGLWWAQGGAATLASYLRLGEHGRARLREDDAWIQEVAQPWASWGQMLFSHAMPPDPDNPETVTWGRPEDGAARLAEGLRVSLHGHTPVKRVRLQQVAEGQQMLLIDTGACFTGVLTALDCRDLQLHQVRGEPL